MNIFKRMGNMFIKYMSLYLSMLIPKNKNCMVFGAWFGNKYADNTKYLYKYVVENCKEIKAIWLTENMDVYRELTSKGYPVKMSNTWSSIWNVMRAKYCFTVTGRRDLGKFDSNFMGNSYHIDLWHGVPLKKVMYDDEFSSKGKTHDTIAKMLEYFPLRKYYVVSTSDVITKIYISAFRCERNHILQFGQSRNDYFYNEHINPYKEKYAQKKIILYMPTHRNEGKTKIEINKILDLKYIDQICADNNCVFLIKKHYYHKDDALSIDEYSNVFDITAQNCESQELLDSADILITDYSSCYIDYLLLNRPIIFYNYDMNDYLSKDRKMYFEYNDVTPGEKCSNANELNLVLNSILSGQDSYKDEREKVCDLFYDKKVQGKVSDIILKYVRNIK
ncbi:MAG: CDP-glycerol glycerophosphotransferase family protein [Lachnospiraceae bacterium]|nr:CDP-glycerol glycerophosphotransferase family protein [Lachnospiraceae bacterium]